MPKKFKSSDPEDPDLQVLARQRAKKPTDRQLKCLEILFMDLGFDRKQRNAWLTEECGVTIRALDDVTFEEAHRFITELKRRKDDFNQKCPPFESYPEDDEPLLEELDFIDNEKARNRKD